MHHSHIPVCGVFVGMVFERKGNEMPELFTKAKNSNNGEVRVREPFRDGLTENNADLERVMISGIREVLRVYNVDRIPMIHGFLVSSTPNAWDDIYIIDVQYAKCGYRAVYGGHHVMADDGINTKIQWQCYMD